MRRIFTLILIALSLHALWSCDIFGTEHTHEFGEWTVIKEATCTEDGSRTRSCSCGESETESVSATGHPEEILAAYPATCTESGLTEGKKCTVCGQITQKQTTIPATGHTETVLAGNSATCTESGLTEGKKCTVCSENTVVQEEIASLGHDCTYTEETDENGNITTLGTCQRSDCGIVIKNPAGLYDKDNNLIASWEDLVNVYGLLANLERVIEENEELQAGTKLIVDDSMTSIISLVKGCESLTKVFIPKSITSIRVDAFQECFSLLNITVSDDNEKYKSVDGILYNKEMNYLLKYPTAKKGSDFTIPDSVSSIGVDAFFENLSLVNITIPNSVTRIGNSAFYDCTSLKNIYFTGTIDEWNEIPNIRLWLPNNALVHCDGRRMFITRGFAGDFGSSGSTAIVYIEVHNNNVYLNKILYDIVSKDEKLNIEYDEYIYYYIDTHNETEKLAVLEQIKACDELYVLEGIDQHGSLQKRICCYIDGTFYILTISNINEDTDAVLINRICYSVIEWEK